MPLYQADDLLLLFYSSVVVGRRITQAETDDLNNGKIPWDNVTSVRRPRGLVHYFTPCGGKAHTTIARTIRDTTCQH